MNVAMEHDARPPFRSKSRVSTTQRRDSSVGMVTCWHCGQRGHYFIECQNPPTARMYESPVGPSTTIGPTLLTAKSTAPHPKAGASVH